MNLRRLIFPSLLILSLAASIEVSRSIAQSAAPPEALPEVSEPEPAPNPVKDKVAPPESEGGIDPELGQIAEPDAPDVVLDDTKETSGPVLDGGVDDQNRSALESIINKEPQKETSAGIMPKLVGAEIPTIPIDLLFPNGGAVGVGKISRVQELSGNNVLLFGQNRNSGASLTFRMNVGQTLNFENLTLKLSACYRSAPSETDESWAYVEVIDRGAPQIQQIAVLAQRDRSKMKELQGARVIRKGWMIASSPNVTAIDHPIYDLSLMECSGGAAAAIVTPEVANKTVRKTVTEKKENIPVSPPQDVPPAQTPAPAPVVAPVAPPPEEKPKQ